MGQKTCVTVTLQFETVRVRMEAEAKKTIAAYLKKTKKKRVRARASAREARAKRAAGMCAEQQFVPAKPHHYIDSLAHSFYKIPYCTQGES